MTHELTGRELARLSTSATRKALPRAVFRASVIVNDLHSVAKEAADELPDSNLILLIADEENCSIRAATERTVRMHNDFVRGFEASQRQLAAFPSLDLQRFLRGAQAWMGGGFEWHSTSRRYQGGRQCAGLQAGGEGPMLGSVSTTGTG